MNLYTTLGNLIKEQRTKQHLTQQELAEKCGLTSSDISRIEKGIGNPTFEKVDKILDALDIMVSEIRFKKVK